eukprot:TRINITY_DN11432_c0_g3_i1.p1 TRINITY_DN11432_c0_g3~~TRINITY_DN11432_c0_g3_i1.p1  ORF type:complete len:499 (-),score=75.42 TRINITY_DN11432_c0_g3_i1:172-1668(-)
MANRDRRLEVIVFAARGIEQVKSQGVARRKVRITISSSKDPFIEEFGAKVSPWSNAEAYPGSDQVHIRFGERGLRCSFPLGNGAPAIAASPNFADTAKVRVQLMSSIMQSQKSNAIFNDVALLLPGAAKKIAANIKSELADGCATVEAEVEIPLANILSGRTGFAADRALGGWMPLHRPGNASGCDVLPDGEQLPLSLWMQMYALPDHESFTPELNAQLERVISSFQAGTPEQGQAMLKEAPALQQKQEQKDNEDAPAASCSTSGLRVASAPRWGPAAAAKNTQAAASNTQRAPEPPKESMNLLDFDAHDGSQTAAPVQSVDLLGNDAPSTGPLGTSLGDVLVGPSPTSAFGFIASSCSGSDAQVSGMPSSNFGASGYNAHSSVQQSYASTALPVAPAAPPADGASAFGFIAAGSPSPTLDLAALYRDTGKPGEDPLAKPAVNAKFAPLTASLAAAPDARATGKLTPASKAAPTPASGRSLDLLEFDMLQGLSGSLKS